MPDLPGEEALEDKMGQHLRFLAAEWALRMVLQSSTRETMSCPAVV
jgi:hypothetical protein